MFVIFKVVSVTFFAVFTDLGNNLSRVKVEFVTDHAQHCIVQVVMNGMFVKDVSLE